MVHFVDAKTLVNARGGVNIYRGCTHGCIYCDSRSRCYRFTHPFEDVEVKRNAPELLEKTLSSKRRKCMIGTGSMSDPYMQCEEDLRLTRSCLEIIEGHGFGATLITKSDLVLRDIDLLESINRKARCVVQMTLTTYDEEMCRILEPNVCGTERRYEVLKELRDRKIPTVVWLTPVLPFINDTWENISGILGYCEEARVSGVICFDMGMTLREGDREYYYAALDDRFPGLKEKYIRTYADSYIVRSPNADSLMRMFRSRCMENGIISDPDASFEFIRRFPEKNRQTTLDI